VQDHSHDHTDFRTVTEGGQEHSQGGGHSHGHSHSSSLVAVLPGYLRWLREHLGDAMRPPRGKVVAAKKSAEFRLADGVTWLGAGVNVLLTAFKAYAGVVSHSAAMIADAVHSLSDLMSDVVTLISMRLARLPPDDDHGYGHERFETVGAMFVGAMLLAAAWGLGETALASLRVAVPLALTTPGIPGVFAVGPVASSFVQPGQWLAACAGNIALWAAATSIVAKEALYRGTMLVAKRLRSPALRANAWHHRSDAMSSVVALVGIFAAAVGGPRLAFCDGLAAAVVALMLGAMGFRISLEALAELTDTVDEADLRAVRESVQGIDGIHSVERSRGRLVAGALVVDVDVVAEDEDLSASASARLAERARLAILQAPLAERKQLKQANVRVVPAHKMCPVVASMASQDDILHTVTAALRTKNYPFAFHDARVHYDSLLPAVDLYLDPRDRNAPLARLDDDARKARADLALALGNRAQVNRIFWVGDLATTTTTTPGR